MRLSIAALVASAVLDACAPTSPPRSPAPIPEVAVGFCAPYRYLMLGRESHEEHDGPALVTAMDDAQRDALGDEAAAQAADTDHRPRDAALAFLACAQRYAAVPDGDHFAAGAIGSARTCYQNAIFAFANAGRFASEGAATLGSAAAADPRNAEFIRAQLASPPSECPPSRRGP